MLRLWQLSAAPVVIVIVAVEQCSRGYCDLGG